MSSEFVEPDPRRRITSAPAPGDLLERYAALCGAVDAGPAELYPTRQCEAARAVLAVDDAGISILLESRLRIPLGSSSEQATIAERLQFTLGEGPCMHAHASDRPVLVPDVADHDSVAWRHWPTYATELLTRTDYRAVFALPLTTSGLSIGTLNLYRREPGDLSTGELVDALAVTNRIFYNLIDTGTFSDEGSASFQWMNTPLAIARTAVWQAIGMITVHQNISSADALDVLRSYSYAANRLLDDVAADIAGRTLSLDELES